MPSDAPDFDSLPDAPAGEGRAASAADDGGILGAVERKLFPPPQLSDLIVPGGSRRTKKAPEFESLPDAAPEPEPTDLTAYRATRAGVQPQQAGRALALSKKTGLAPQFVADNLQEVQQSDEQRTLTQALAGMPVTAEYAGQSAVHAAAVKNDVGVLEALEMGFSDVGYALHARSYMDSGDASEVPLLQGYEEAATDFAKRPSGMLADLARALPSIGLYGAATVAGSVGTPLGSALALRAALYQLNRGVLYRKIWAQAPIPDLADVEAGKAELFDPVAFDARAKEYAWKGASIGALIAGALGDSFTAALPGASAALQKVGVDIVAKGVGEAIVKRGTEWVGHTLSGALMMAGQATVDDATVQKATTGKIDLPEALHAGGRAFKDGLATAAILSAYTPGRELVTDLGRIHDAPVEAAHLGAQVDQASQLKLPKDEAEQLIGKMAADSKTPTVYVDGEKAQEHAVKLVEVLADEGQALAEAKATGGDVAVPIEKYVTGMADQHQVLKDDVKLSPDGLTPRQAESLRQELDGWQAHADADQNAKTIETRPLPELAAEKYGGTPERWAERLTPDTVKKLQAAIAAKPPEPQPAAWQGRAAADWAAELVDRKRIAEIQPGRYELAARRAEDQFAAVAKEGAEKGVKAARQGFLGAGMQSLDSAAPEAGKQNLREAGRTADVADRRVAKLPMLERARDLARAMAAQAADVRKEMDKAREYLDSRDDPKYRADLALAGPEYVNAFDSILDAVDPAMAGSKKLSGALDAVLGKMQQQGALVGFDEQGLRDVMDGGRGWNKLTPPEARNVVDAVKNIRKAAHDANAIALSDKAYTLREFVGSVTDEASTRKDLGAPPLTDSAASPMETAARAAGLFNAANLKPETIFDRLGETAHRFYEDKLIAARDRKAELQGEHLKYFMQHFDKEMRGLRRWLRQPVQTSLTIPAGVDLDGTKINNETLAMAFLNLGAPGNEQRLLSGYGWDKTKLLEEIGKNIPRQKLDLLQGILTYNDEKIWPLIRDHAEARTGIAPPKVQAQPIKIHLVDGTTWEGKGGYFPAAPNRRALGVPLHMQSDVPGGVEPDQAARMTVQASFTKERTAKATYPIDLNWNRYPQHLASVFHFLAYDDAVRDVGKLLRDDEFQRTMRHYVGEPYLQQLQQDQRVWARGSVGDANGTMDYVSRAIGSVFRTRAVSNALAFSTPIALGQESHIQYAVTSGQISLKNATAAMARQLPWTDTWVATRSILDEVRFRSDRYSEQFREAISGQPARTMLGHGLDRAAFAQMEAADAIISHVIGDAALNDALEAKLPMEDAVREANRKVRLLMPTHNTMEMAPIVRSRGTIGALMLFRGLPNVVWNVENGLYDEAKQGVASASGAGQLAAASGRVALNTARAAASLAVLHLLGRLLMGHGKTDEDGEGIAGWGTWAEREAIASQFARVPLGRDVAEPFIDAYFHDKGIGTALKELADGQHLAPDVAVVYNVLKNAATVGMDEKAPEDRVQAAADTALTLLGAGGRPVTRGPRYLYDLQQGNVAARGPGDVVGGVIHGQRPRQAKNVFTAAQDAFSGE